MRPLFGIAFALLFGSAHAQFSPPAQQVARFAPQLTAFAGSPSNFESLAGGLQSGSTVTLTTTGADGVRETATFQAAQPMTALDVARVLEAARQQLIMRGIGSPTAQQIAVALMGGTLAAPGGKVEMAPLVAAADPKKPFSVASQTFGGSAANFKSLTDGLSKGTRITLDAKEGAVNFVPPGGEMSAQDVTQTLQMASQLLAQQGIHNPTPEQIRAALVGGTVKDAAGADVRLRGVLEGRARAISDSARAGGTSDSPQGRAPTSATTQPPTSASPQPGGTSASGVLGTSDSKVRGTSDSRPR